MGIRFPAIAFFCLLRRQYIALGLAINYLSIRWIIYYAKLSPATNITEILVLKILVFLKRDQINIGIIKGKPFGNRAAGKPAVVKINTMFKPGIAAYSAFYTAIISHLQ